MLGVAVSSAILGIFVTCRNLTRKVFVCRNFIPCAVATFWAMSLVGIYPGRPSIIAGFSAYVTVLLGVSIEGV